MWFTDKTPKPASLPANLYRIEFRPGLYRPDVEVEAHEYARRDDPDLVSWFVFLKDGRIVAEVTASAVHSVRLIEPDLFVFEFLFDDKGPADLFEAGKVGDFLGHPYFKLHTDDPTPDIKVTGPFTRAEMPDDIRAQVDDLMANGVFPES